MEVKAPDTIPEGIRAEARRHFESADDFTPRFRQFVRSVLDELMPYFEDAVLRIKLEALAAEMRPPLGEEFTVERASALLCVLKTALKTND